AALAMGAHPYKIAQVHWHASPVDHLLEKMGIDWRSAKGEFMDYLKALKSGTAPELLHAPREEIERYFAINKGQVLPVEETGGLSGAVSPGNGRASS
ncbi:CoB--CoM heterodisulfide reductase subunit B, partial [mine drainage metagenome]